MYRVPSKVVTSGKAPSYGLAMSRLMKNPVMFATFDAGKSDQARVLKIWEATKNDEERTRYEVKQKDAIFSDPVNTPKYILNAAWSNSTTEKSNYLCVCGDNGYLFIFEGNTAKVAIQLSASPIGCVIDCGSDVGFVAGSKDGVLHVVPHRIVHDRTQRVESIKLADFGSATGNTKEA